jgi:hypothetical protein
VARKDLNITVNGFWGRKNQITPVARPSLQRAQRRLKMDGSLIEGGIVLEESVFVLCLLQSKISRIDYAVCAALEYQHFHHRASSCFEAEQGMLHIVAASRQATQKTPQNPSGSPRKIVS